MYRGGECGEYLYPGEDQRGGGAAVFGVKGETGFSDLPDPGGGYRAGRVIVWGGSRGDRSAGVTGNIKRSVAAGESFQGFVGGDRGRDRDGNGDLDVVCAAALVNGPENLTLVYAAVIGRDIERRMGWLEGRGICGDLYLRYVFQLYPDGSVEQGGDLYAVAAGGFSIAGGGGAVADVGGEAVVPGAVELLMAAGVCESIPAEQSDPDP